jgi:hypothetical protein
MTGDLPTAAHRDAGRTRHRKVLLWIADLEQTFHQENHIELKTVFRQKDPVYRKILSETRDGRISHESYNAENPTRRKKYPALHNGCVP